MRKRTVQEYVDLPYRTRVVGEETPGGPVIYVASHPELPGCMAQGDTPEEAVAELRHARELYINGLRKRGLEVPEPAAPPPPQFPELQFHIIVNGGTEIRVWLDEEPVESGPHAVPSRCTGLPVA